MQITKFLSNKKALAVAVGLACAVGFSAPSQAHYRHFYSHGYYSHGCATCGVHRYRTYYRHYRPYYNYGYNSGNYYNYGCNSCGYSSCYSSCDSCNYCNSCNYSWGCNGCGYGYYYGGYYY